MLGLGKALAIFTVLYLASPMGGAAAETADTVLFNGKILTVDKDFSVQQALAIGHGEVLASGTTAAMKRLASENAKLIDLGGRTVIPGLTDGHIHGIRAALTFGTEINADYLTAPVKEVGKIRSLLTMVGGKVVYATEPFTNMAASKTIGKPR